MGKTTGSWAWLRLPEECRERGVALPEPVGASCSEPASPWLFLRAPPGTRCLARTLAFSSSGRSSRSTTGGVSAPLGDAMARNPAEIPPTVWGTTERRGVEFTWPASETDDESGREVGVPLFLGGILGTGGVPAYWALRALRSGVPTAEGTYEAG